MIKDKVDVFRYVVYNCIKAITKQVEYFINIISKKLITCFVFAETLSSKQSPSFPIKTSFLYKKIHNKSLENSLYISRKMLLQ